MKIAMIGHKRVPSREGGVEIVVEELSVRFAKKRNKVVLFNRKGSNVQDKTIKQNKIKEYKGCKIKTIPTINKKGLEALLYSFFATILALFGGYDVIHYHAEGPCAMLWIPHLFGIRTVATIHGLDWQRAKWGGFATRFLKFGEWVAAKYADEIIVLSENVKKYFKDKYNRETVFIPNGIDKPILRKPNIIKEKYGLDKNDYVLFLARIVPEKGLHYLIDAFKQIDTNKKLVIAGGSSHTDEYLESIKEMAKTDDRIIMTGFVQGEELDELYSNCYLYCLPSDIEGMPISLLEAMSYGCNCLVSNIEENTQVIDDYGYTFEKSNVADLKERLTELFDKKLECQNELISNYILEKYNWDNVVDQTEKLYKKKKRIKHDYKCYIIIACLYLLVFQNVFQSLVSFIKYFDEFLAVFFVVIFIYKLIKKKIELSKSAIIIICCMFGIYILGITSNFLYNIQVLSSVVSDMIVVSKFFLVYFMASSILTTRLMKKSKDLIIKNIKIMIIILFFLTIINYIFQIWPGEVRYGIMSNKLFFGHYTILAASASFLLISYIGFSKRVISLYSIMCSILIVLTLRSKAIGFGLLFLILALLIIKYEKKIKVKYLSILIILALLLGYKQIKYYFFNPTGVTARQSLLIKSFDIANDYFPLGTGFGTYASHFSSQPYSKVYYDYGLNTVYGISPTFNIFISDSFWPMILGQFGYIGLLLYMACVILIFINLQNSYRKNKKYIYLAKIGCLLYLLISSTSESAFVNSFAIMFAIILGYNSKMLIFKKENKQWKKK